MLGSAEPIWRTTSINWISKTNKSFRLSFEYVFAQRKKCLPIVFQGSSCLWRRWSPPRVGVKIVRICSKT